MEQSKEEQGIGQSNIVKQFLFTPIVSVKGTSKMKTKTITLGAKMVTNDPATTTAAVFKFTLDGLYESGHVLYLVQSNLGLLLGRGGIYKQNVVAK